MKRFGTLNFQAISSQGAVSSVFSLALNILQSFVWYFQIFIYLRVISFTSSGDLKKWCSRSFCSCDTFGVFIRKKSGAVIAYSGLKIVFSYFTGNRGLGIPWKGAKSMAIWHRFSRRKE